MGCTGKYILYECLNRISMFLCVNYYVFFTQLDAVARENTDKTLMVLVSKKVIHGVRRTIEKAMWKINIQNLFTATYMVVTTSYEEYII
jgi:hypothetical protein